MWSAKGIAIISKVVLSEGAFALFFLFLCLGGGGLPSLSPWFGWFNADLCSHPHCLNIDLLKIFLDCFTKLCVQCYHLINHDRYFDSISISLYQARG